MLAISDAHFYPAPVAMMMTELHPGSGQRVPGGACTGASKVVYLGCLLLIIGIFAMLYVRERRLWVWLSPVSPDGTAPEGTTSATMAFSVNRKTIDSDREFEHLQAASCSPLNKEAPETL